MLLAILASLGTLGPVNTPCITKASAEQLAGRPSPLDSVSATIGGATVKVCYGRPSLNGRTAVGGQLAPFGRIWRTGANEPTMIHTSAPITLGNVRLPAGSHSIYTIPGEQEWAILLNRGTEQWGTQYPEAQEVGRATGTVSAMATPVERFTIRLTASALVMEWEKTRVTVPVAAAK